MSERKASTVLAHGGRHPEAFQGAVNPPVFHVSTVLYDQLAGFETPRRHYIKGHMAYGRTGTPTHFALQEAVAELEAADDAIITSSGLAAISATLLTFLGAGDHLLMVDSVYEPVRRHCDKLLRRLGIEIEYYAPSLGPEIARLVRPNTKAIYLESPGSLTFEVQDTCAIVEAAKAASVPTILDNTWATPLYFRPLELDIDVSIQSGSKYLSGHSDLMLGVIAARGKTAQRLRQTVYLLGNVAGPDDVYLALRGLRTLGVRLAQHSRNALAVARWLDGRPEVARVLYPALPSDPGHRLWQRDFTGASGLFGVVLDEVYPKQAVAAFLEQRRYFGIGASWGGYESLMIAAYPEHIRTATQWQAPGRTLRLHIGLEDPADLIADLEAGLDELVRHKPSARQEGE